MSSKDESFFNQYYSEDDKNKILVTDKIINNVKNYISANRLSNEALTSGVLWDNVVNEEYKSSSNLGHAPSFAQHFIAIRPVSEYSYMDIGEVFFTLGRADFRVSFSTELKLSGTDLLITIKKIGIFIHDSFDFNGNQDLGIWDVLRMQLTVTTTSEVFYKKQLGVFISNSAFRNYRSLTGNVYGKDFILYLKPVVFDTNYEIHTTI